MLGAVGQRQAKVYREKEGAIISLLYPTTTKTVSLIIIIVFDFNEALRGREEGELRCHPADLIQIALAGRRVVYQPPRRRRRRRQRRRPPAIPEDMIILARLEFPRCTTLQNTQRASQRERGFIRLFIRTPHQTSWAMRRHTTTTKLWNKNERKGPTRHGWSRPTHWKWLPIF